MRSHDARPPLLRIDGRSATAPDTDLTIRPRTRTRTPCSLITVKSLPDFDAWLAGLKDRPTRLQLLRRLQKAHRGLLGDIAPVGDGVFEMREFFGPGWRRYDIQHHDILIVMLGGGYKSSQSSDIAKAQALAAHLKDD